MKLKPKSKNSKVRLIQGDCLNKMTLLSDKSVDLILCDLPYGVTQNKEDIRIPFEPLWSEYERIIKDNGAIILFSQGEFFIDLVNSNRKLFRYDLIWDKVLVTGHLNAKLMPLRRHEQICVFYKKPPTYNPQFFEGSPTHSKGTAYKTKKVVNNNYGNFKYVDNTSGSTKKYPTSIITIRKPHPSKAKHRTEKPIDLLEYLIRTYSNEGDIVLDNCMGSGSTGIACINTNRRFIGIELNEEIFKVAEDRINELTIQKTYDKI